MAINCRVISVGFWNGKFYYFGNTCVAILLLNYLFSLLSWFSIFLSLQKKIASFNTVISCFDIIRKIRPHRSLGFSSFYSRPSAQRC